MNAPMSARPAAAEDLLAHLPMFEQVAADQRLRLA
jgi:hypothetical protein